MSSVVSGLETVWEAITNLPSKIADGLKSFFDDLKNAIADLPNKIKEVLRDLFVPSPEYITNSFNSFLEELRFKFQVDTGVFEELFVAEQPVTDVKGDYEISGVGTFNLTFFDSKFFKDGVAFFRPFVRGFIVLMIFLYNIKQLIGFFGYDSGVVTGRSEHIKSAKEGQ